MRTKKLYILLIVIWIATVMTGCSEKGNDVEFSTMNAGTSAFTETASEEIYVDVSGEVKNEGVYCVKSGSRLYQVIEKAGGFTKKAERQMLNLAETVCDGQKIQVLSKKQYKEQNAKLSDDTRIQSTENDLLDINTATAEQLTDLPGIGSTKAKAIVSYREEKGKFSSIEDLKNVSGIGDATFANIKSMITIN